MRPKPEFIERWRPILAGHIALGAADFHTKLNRATGTAEDFGRTMIHIQAVTDALLARLYDDLATSPVVSPDPKGTK